MPAIRYFRRRRVAASPRQTGMSAPRAERKATLASLLSARRPAIKVEVVNCRGIRMKIHEYQAKELLAAAGAAVPRGVVASSPDEAVKAFDGFGGKPVVLKAQVHAGGRGKGRFKGANSD